MEFQREPDVGANPQRRTSTREPSVAMLVAAIYDNAPPSQRVRILDQLLRPLGLLSLCGIAGGVFATIRFRNRREFASVRIEDTDRVQPNDVVALVEHVQQVDVETITGLAQILVTASERPDSTAAAFLARVAQRVNVWHFAETRVAT
jgi:hypothetical protein